MDRKTIKTLLETSGMSKELLQMPAVMERMYLFCGNKTLSDFLETVTISDSGREITVDADKKFVQTENGAMYINSSTSDRNHGKYIIDEFGMDQSYLDGDDLFMSSSLYRNPDRTITASFSNSSSNSKSINEDNGDPIINYYNYTIFQEGKTPSLGWEGNKVFLLQNYPITQKWFDIRSSQKDSSSPNIEAQVTDSSTNRIEELENQKQEMQKIMKMLIDQNHEQSDTIKKLELELSKSQVMLTRVLHFCDVVKASSIGKVFFRKHIKKLPESFEDKEY